MSIRKTLVCWLLGAVLATGFANVFADNLYEITLNSQAEADLLNGTNIKPVYKIRGGYLAIADERQIKNIIGSGIEVAPIANNISLDELAIDRRIRKDVKLNLETVYESNGLIIYKLLPVDRTKALADGTIMPLRDFHLEFIYKPSLTYYPDFSMGDFPLDSLIGLVSQDTIYNWLHRLEAFNGRLTGTDSCYAARDWIASKFTEMGYDSVVLDSFIGKQLWDRHDVESQNVVAVKPGTRYPGRQIIIGGHYDAVPDCPGVDDNGTGTVGTMEIARVLKDIETEMTFIFIAFDSEESWLWGSDHYAEEAYQRGDTIVHMQNLDMIGHFNNSDLANIYYDMDTTSAKIWQHLGDSLVGIWAVLAGSTASDQESFWLRGYDATFVQEYHFSTEYHQPSDSTTYINFDYMTRMIKASLAADYVMNLAPSPVILTSVRDVGDGQTLKIEWVPRDPAELDHYTLYFNTKPASQLLSVQLAPDLSSYDLSGLVDGQKYTVYLTATNTEGYSSFSYHSMDGIPSLLPLAPAKITARPLLRAIVLDWSTVSRPLDFSHFQIIRDGNIISDPVMDSFFVDSDPSLGNVLHSYLVRAVDNDGYLSDTAGIVPVSSKAATLEPGTILAVNRTSRSNIAMVDEAYTGAIMRAALDGMSYTDATDADSGRTKDLLDLIDFETVVIAAEGARMDELETFLDGFPEDLAYYCSLGGKTAIFGRFGDITTSSKPRVDSFLYLPPRFYSQVYHIDWRIVPRTEIVTNPTWLNSDCIGAHSHMPGYPNLAWDSARAVHHTEQYFPEISGIPCASFVELAGTAPEIIYTYDSRNDSTLTEGKTVAWRYLSPEYSYVFFELPLSFMDSASAVAALRQAVLDLDQYTDAEDDGPGALPDAITLKQNYPNPFNPTTTIEFYNPGSRLTDTQLEVFNILGQRVRVLFDGPAAPGLNQVQWDGCDGRGNSVASGIYLYRLKIDAQSQTRKMILLK